MAFQLDSGNSVDRPLRLIHNSVRTDAVHDSAMLTRLCELLTREEERCQFARWIEFHRIRAVGKEQPVTAWLQQLIDKTKFDRVLGYKATTITLLNWIAKKLESGEFSDPNEAAMVLLGATLGLEFAIYSPTMRQSYNHWLSMDVLSESTKSSVMASVAIQEGHGSIGSIVKQARASGNIQGPIVHWSNLLDPVGTVALDDLVQGSQSWVAIPIADEEADCLGVVFGFHPVPGLFIKPCSSEPRNEAKNVVTHKTQSQNWVKCFDKHVGGRRRELILALQLDASNRLMETSRLIASLQFDTSSSNEANWNWIKSALINSDERCDPLGFQLLLYTDQDPDSSDDIVAKVFLREEVMVNRYLELMRNSCIYPNRWAPFFVKRMQSQIDVGGDLFSFDWKSMTNSKRSLIESNSILIFEEGHSGSERQKNVATDEIVELVESAVGLMQRKGNFCFVLPLQSHPNYAEGVLRIECFDNESLQDIETEKTHMNLLQKLFISQEIGIDFQDQLSELLHSFSNLLAKDGLAFSDEKVIRDFRNALCNLTTDVLSGRKLNQAGQQETSTTRQEIDNSVGGFFNLLMMGKNLEIKAIVDQAEAYCSHLVCLASRLTSFRSIVFISIWLNEKRSIIVGSKSEFQLDSTIFLEDPGAHRVLAFALNRFRNTKDKVVLSLIGNRHFDFSSEYERDLVVVPPVFFNHGDCVRQFTTLTILPIKEPSKETQTAILKYEDASVEINWQWVRSLQIESCSCIEGNLTKSILTSDTESTSQGFGELFNDVLPDGNTNLEPVDLSTSRESAQGRAPMNTWERMIAVGDILTFTRRLEIGHESKLAVVCRLDQGNLSNNLIAFANCSKSTIQQRQQVDALRRIQLEGFRTQSAIELADTEQFRAVLGWGKHIYEGLVLKDRFLRNQSENILCLLDALIGNRSGQLRKHRKVQDLATQTWKWFGESGNRKIERQFTNNIDAEMEYSFDALRFSYMVFANLLHNAAKFVDQEDGKLRFRIDPATMRIDQLRKVDGLPELEGYLFEVENSGVRMPQHFADYLMGKRKFPSDYEGRALSRRCRGLKTVVWWFKLARLPFPEVYSPSGFHGTGVRFWLPKEDFSIERL